MAATTTATTTAPTAAPVSSATGEFTTAAGTVYADCSSGAPVLAGVPVSGWSVDDSLDPGEMEFASGDQRVEVRVSCVDGAPVFGQDDHASPSSGSDDGPGDDSSGRDGGGHGSDDGPGDDSSGRHGGGHGSDD